jgi:signal transduction histidine kinase/CheY-like chemotaxis protein
MDKQALQILFRGVSTPEFEAAMKTDADHNEWSGELPEFTKDGRTITVQSRATLILDEAGHPKSRLIINTDITERKRLEEQFLRAQRLEGLGVLVSGIAHDLNNAISPILIGANILQDDPRLPAETKGIVKTMEASAQRGAEMVRQVLTFARGGEARKMPIRVEQLVKETGRIIADTFPKNIHCRVQTHPDLWPVHAIPTQLHQVLMNLCVNARDAMPEGGSLVISLNNERFDANQAARVPGAKPGSYLCLAVTDTGMGIPPEHRDKIFQPFFTTKAPDKGTGLGLSTSMTIVKNHGGFMTVDSKVDRGTEFKFYLPAATGPTDNSVPPKPVLPNGNGERIMVVDDEEAVLAIVRTTLEHYGYRVMTANGGLEAVAQFSPKRKEIDLVITDLVMPFMDGRATILTLRKMTAEIKVIAMSGVEQDKSGLLERGFKTSGFIAKPFTTESLVKAVQLALAPQPVNGPG